MISILRLQYSPVFFFCEHELIGLGYDGNGQSLRVEDLARAVFQHSQDR